MSTDEFGRRFAELTSERARAVLRVPLFAAGEPPAAWFVATYDRRDPLVVEVEIRSPQGLAVCAGLLLRSDFSEAFQSSVTTGPIALSPGEHDTMTLEIRDGRSALSVALPRNALAGFLRSAYQIVSSTAEEAVLGELAAGLGAQPR